jgi:hypothetical protein
VPLAPPVEELRVRRLGDRAVAGWIWPVGVHQASVVWSTPERGIVERRLTETEYRDGGGCQLVVGAGGGRVTVRTLVRGAAGPILSDPRSLDVDGVAARVSYRIVRSAGIGRLRSRHVVWLTADVECTGLDVIIALWAGLTAPRGRAGWMVLRQVDAVSLRAGEPAGFDFRVPRDVRSPYVVRCFVESAEPLSVVHPPVFELRAT